MIDNPAFDPVNTVYDFIDTTSVIVHAIVSCVFTKRFLNNEKAEIQINVSLIHNVEAYYIHRKENLEKRKTRNKSQYYECIDFFLLVKNGQNRKNEVKSSY